MLDTDSRGIDATSIEWGVDAATNLITDLCGVKLVILLKLKF